MNHPDRNKRRLKVDAWIEAWREDRDRETNFRRLFDEHYAILLAFFSRRGLPTEVCEDLIQETFLRVYRGLEGFRGDVPFDLWLFEIAANVLRQDMRRQGSLKRSANEVSLDESRGGTDGEQEPPRGERLQESGPDVLQGVLDRERLRVVELAVAELPAQMRRCAILRWHHEYPVRDIATVLQVSPETVKVHLFKARQRLKERLGSQLEPGTVGAGGGRH